MNFTPTKKNCHIMRTGYFLMTYRVIAVTAASFSLGKKIPPFHCHDRTIG